MKETRYLLRVGHAGRFQPADHAHVMARLQEAFRSTIHRPAHLRISSAALEFDVYSSAHIEESILRQALSSLGPLLTFRRLDDTEEARSRAEAVHLARDFFNEQRFWEVHEVLEAVWRKATGAEKVGVQGLILVAAALVHGQRNEPAVMQTMLRDARPRLDRLSDRFESWNIVSFRQQVDHWIRSPKAPFPTTQDFMC